MQFRPLNVLERTAIQSATKKNKLDREDLRFLWQSRLRVSYERQSGGFTICIIVLTINTLVACSSLMNLSATMLYRGVSRKSRNDAWNSTRGDMLAFNRALQSKGVELPL